jgi:hypothetical protein
MILKLVALCVIIYIIYKIVMFIKEDREISEKLHQEEVDRQSRIHRIPEKNRICANCVYQELPREQYLKWYPHLVRCSNRYVSNNDERDGTCRNECFDPRKGTIYDCEDISNFDLTLQELNQKYQKNM